MPNNRAPARHPNRRENNTASTSTAIRLNSGLPAMVSTFMTQSSGVLPQSWIHRAMRWSNAASVRVCTSAVSAARHASARTTGFQDLAVSGCMRRRR